MSQKQFPNIPGYQKGSNYKGYGKYYDKMGRTFEVNENGNLYQIN